MRKRTSTNSLPDTIFCMSTSVCPDISFVWSLSQSPQLQQRPSQKSYLHLHPSQSPRLHSTCQDACETLCLCLSPCWGPWLILKLNLCLSPHWGPWVTQTGQPKSEFLSEFLNKTKSRQGLRIRLYLSLPHCLFQIWFL